jgi:hypothetical protein
MKRIKRDITNQRFGRLVAISLSPTRTSDGHVQWVCQCDCGNTRPAPTSSLIRGIIKSCGCLQPEIAAARLAAWNSENGAIIAAGKTTHGGSSSRQYGVWRAMKERCSNPKNKDYANYGGRGIRVCERWHTYDNFLADMGPRPPGLSIERRNNNLGYSPDNCYWATRLEQNHNQRPRYSGLCKRGHALDRVDPKTGARHCSLCKAMRGRLSRATWQAGVTAHINLDPADIAAFIEHMKAWELKHADKGVRVSIHHA